jgi:hypothetical protein
MTMDRQPERVRETMEYAVWIVSSDGYIHSECFREVAETIQYGLRSLGHAARITTKPVAGARHIVLGWHNISIFGLECPPMSIIYNLEQLEDNHLFDVNDHVDFLRRHIVWDYSKENSSILMKYGVRVSAILPICYYPGLKRIENSNEKDIDVLFIGSINERRKRIINDLKKLGLNSYFAFGVYESERDNLISRSKILLNMHSYKAQILEQVRISYYLANSIAVLSEYSNDFKTDREWSEGVRFCDYEAMVDAAARLCKDDAERLALAARGFEFFRKRRIEPFLKAALDGSVPGDDVEGFPEFRRNGPCFCGSGRRYKHCHGAGRSR